jgi:hypothetical protein
MADDNKPDDLELLDGWAYSLQSWIEDDEPAIKYLWTHIGGPQKR